MADSADAAPVVDIAIQCDGWREIADLERLTRRAVVAACAAAARGQAGEISVVFADDALQRDLNRRFRGRDAPTNVLSFPSDPPLIGDIILARETVLAEARDQGKSPAAHIAHLLVHGTLHLLGYDHQTARDRRTMESLEIKVLLELGVSNPYLLAHERH